MPLGSERSSGSAVRFPVITTRLILVAAIVLAPLVCPVIRDDCDTCLCPRTGFPDFATINVRYVPGPSCVELKSLKLYINGFRDQGAFHEAAVNGILDDLVGLLNPRYCEVVGDFNVRGNRSEEHTSELQSLRHLVCRL